MRGLYSYHRSHRWMKQLARRYDATMVYEA